MAPAIRFLRIGSMERQKSRCGSLDFGLPMVPAPGNRMTRAMNGGPLGEPGDQIMYLRFSGQGQGRCRELLKGPASGGRWSRDGPDQPAPHLAVSDESGAKNGAPGMSVLSLWRPVISGGGHANAPLDLSFSASKPRKSSNQGGLQYGRRRK